ncbi:MAG: putative bifunctional diguanylate cyclase/phosphodiesterase [Frankiaceae bacterium]
MLIDRTSRNTAPRAGAVPFFAYLGIVVAIGLGIVGWAASRLAVTDISSMGAGFLLVAAIVAIAEARPLVLAGIPDTNGVSITTTFVFATLIHWGFAVAVVLQAVVTFVGERLWHKVWWRSAFNIAQYALSWGAAAVVLALCGHGASPLHPDRFTSTDIVPAIAAGSAYFLVNDALVANAIALRVRSSLWRAFIDDFGYQAVSNAALLALAPFVAVALDSTVALVLLLLPPLLALYKNASVSLEKEHASLHDTLTGLANRKLLFERAADVLEEAHRTGGQAALFVLDLDRFKEVNDTLGHQVGDRLLQCVGARLRHVVRPVDMVARLGGDEFAVLLPALDGLAEAQDVAARIGAALREAFAVDGMRFDLEASIGIAMHPEHADDFESLLRHADVAMYLAKESRSGMQTYDPARDHNSTERLALLGELRRALEDGQLELHYQPKADLATGQVVGVEALVRWRHPERGMVAPDEFVPLAEQTGLMRDLTDFVVGAAAGQVAAWRDAGIVLPVAVNVSVRDLHDARFTEHLRASCERWLIDPAALLLEITEGVLLRDPERTTEVLHELAAMGVALSLDDFGTGYSSLAHLKRLPVSEIKIDRSFVQRMDAGADDAAIVRSIIDLGDALGLRVVAEGVETAAAWEHLRAMGCDAAQGFFLAVPMPPAEATAWLSAAMVRPPLRALPARAGRLA